MQAYPLFGVSRKPRGYLGLVGAALMAASLACNSSAQPTAAPSATPAQSVQVLTPIAVTDTPAPQPTAVTPLASPTPTAILNDGTPVPSPAGTLETDCINTYLPVQKGATWTYSGSVTGNNVNKQWTQVETITDVGSQAFLMEVKLPDKTLDATWKCTHDGLVSWQSDGGLFSAVVQGPTGNVTVETTAVTGVTLPVSIQAGDVWQQRSVLQISDQKSASATGELFVQFRAIGPEPVSAPAGNFNAMRFDVHAEFLIHSGKGLLTTFDGSQWMEPVLGLVKRSGSLTFIQGQPPSQLDFELTSHNIP